MTGLCWGTDSRCVDATTQYAQTESWKMEMTCKWQVTKGANCQWFPRGSAGKCSGSDSRCEGTADMNECYSIGSCKWSSEEQVDTSGVVMVTASDSAHGQRRLRETPTHADLSVQLAIKHGIAASYTNVEPFEVAITKNEVRGQDMKLSYKILVVGTANRSPIAADELVKVANEELDEQSINMTFANAKMEAVSTQHQTRMFSFEKRPAATSSTESSSTGSSEPRNERGSEMVSRAAMSRGMFVLTLAVILAPRQCSTH